MSLKNTKTAVVIALQTPDEEKELQERLKKELATKSPEFYLCEGGMEYALEQIESLAVLRHQVLLYTTKQSLKGKWLYETARRRLKEANVHYA